jgi:hypothetical protein
VEHKSTRMLSTKLFSEVELVGQGVDWITCTATSSPGRQNLTSLWAKYSAKMSALGETTKKSGFQGFQGALCGPLFFGRREDTLLLRISSGLADEVFPLIAWSEVKCTRIDLQVTVRLAVYDGSIAEDLAWRRAHNNEHLGQPLTPTQRLVKGYGAGDTLYIGSRTSPRYGRIYDKQKESPAEAYDRCWRFEIEYKRVMAPKVVEWLMAQSDRSWAIVEAVKGQCEQWDIECPTVAKGSLIPGSIGRRTFDNDRALNWLRTQVAPSVERLLGTCDIDDILGALNLATAIPAGKIVVTVDESLISFEHGDSRLAEQRY